MTQRENCLNVIDELHKLAHNGAFDNVDLSVIEAATDILSSFLGVKVNLDQASKITGLKKPIISNHISRKCLDKEKPRHYRLISWATLKKILPIKG